MDGRHDPFSRSDRRPAIRSGTWLWTRRALSWGVLLAAGWVFWAKALPDAYRSMRTGCEEHARPNQCSMLLLLARYTGDDAGPLYYHRGLARYRRGNSGSAVKDFRRAAVAGHSGIYLDYYLGRALYEDDAHEAAGAAFTRALEAGANDRARIWRGWARLEFDRAGAVEDFDRVEAGTKAEEFREWIHRGRGQALSRLGRDREAIADLERAVEIAPEVARAWSDYSWTLRKLGRFEDALAAADKAIALSKNYRWANILRGDALVKLKRYEEAIEVFDRAIEENFWSHSSHAAKTEALIELGRPEEALIVSELTAERHFLDMEDLILRLRAQCALGQRREARNTVRRLLADYPSVGWLARDLPLRSGQVCDVRR